MKKNTGGTAFPVKVDDTTIILGMTLRDYFAAKAMLGFLELNMNNEYLPSETAKEAYRYADAMLKAREE